MGDPDSDEDVSVSLSMTMIHSDCVVTPEDTGLALTLNGAPNLAISLALSIMGDLGFALSGEVDGTVRWATDDGRSGSCRIDLDIEAEIGPSGFTHPGSLRPSPGRHVELNSQSQTRGCSASDEYGARIVATVDDILAPPPDL